MNEEVRDSTCQTCYLENCLEKRDAHFNKSEKGSTIYFFIKKEKFFGLRSLVNERLNYANHGCKLHESEKHSFPSLANMVFHAIAPHCNFFVLWFRNNFSASYLALGSLISSSHTIKSVLANQISSAAGRSKTLPFKFPTERKVKLISNLSTYQSSLFQLLLLSFLYSSNFVT